MVLTLQPVRVATNSADEDGQLVFSRDRLVGVLIQLSAGHGELEGRWFLETGYGRLNGNDHPVFSDLDEARDWILRRLDGPGVGPARQAHQAPISTPD